MNDKRKWIILAVILLLFIGLGAYVFAGSGEELLTGTGNNSGETENNGGTTTDGNTLDEEEEDNTTTETTTTNTNKLTTTATDTSYDAALAAVVQAESSLTQADVDTATSLIAAVTSGDDTTSLTERLATVQALIDLTSLVETLQSYVEDATSLSDITDARTYESTNTIIALVESLDESDTKTSLTNIINSISSILEDETSPVINVSTLNSESYANSAITVTVTEDNDYTIYLDGVETTLSELSSLTDGTYTIKVVDASYNEQSVTFTIDTESPVITVASSTGANNVYSTVELNLTDTDSLASVSINGEVTDISGTLSTITFDNSYDDGDYEVILTDVAGNTETYSFTLDNTIPEIEVASNKYTVGGLSSSNSYSKLSVKTTDNYSLAGLYINDTLVKTITGVTNSTYNKIEEYFVSYLNEGEENTIYVMDQAGNKSNVITFVYDTTAASIAYTSYKTSDSDTASNTLSYWTDTLRISMASNEKLGQSATVTITDSEGTEFVYTASLEFDLVNSGGQYIYTTTYDLPERIAEGEVTITISDVYDLAGNETEAFNYKYYEKTIIVDTTAGTATISTSNYFINSSRVSIDVTIDEENIDSVYYTFSGYADEDSLIANKKSDEWVSQTYLDSSNSFTITWDITGSTYLWIKIVDKAGNVGYVRSDKFVLDTESPVIYANDSETISSYYNEDVIIKVTDDNIELPIKVEYTDVDSNTTTKEYDTDEFELEEDGTYSITATDKAGNTSTVTFEIDKTSPVVTLYKYEKEYTGRTELAFDGYYSYSLAVSIEDDNSYTAILTDASGKEYTFTEMSEIGSRANYTLTVTDVAGNVTVVEFAIDKDKPQITGVSDGDITNQNITVVATDTNLDTVVLYKNNELVNGYENGSEISEEGTYIITATDKAGNTSTVTFEIDKTAPEATISFGVVSSTSKYATVGDLVRVALTFDEELATLPTVVLNGTSYTAKLATSSNGTYTYQAQIKVSESTTNGKVTLTVSGYADAVGNVGTTYTEEDFEEIIIDNQVPTITATGVNSDGTVTVEDGDSYQNVDLTITDDTLKSVVVTKDSSEIINYTSNDQIYEVSFTDEGTYVVTASDRFGYTSTLTFIIDTSPATKEGADFRTNGKNYDELYYATVGNNIILNVRFNEQLAELPTFKIIDSEGNYITVTAREYDWTSTYGTYMYQISYTVTEDTPLVDGKLTFEISNIVDKAGNVYDGVITTTSNNKEVELDTESPIVTVENVNYSGTQTITYNSSTDNGNINAYITDNIGLYTVYRNSTEKFAYTSGDYVIYYKDRFSAKDTYTGGYTIIATDFAGNTTTVYFEYETANSLSSPVSASAQLSTSYIVGFLTKVSDVKKLYYTISI